MFGARRRDGFAVLVCAALVAGCEGQPSCAPAPPSPSCADDPSALDCIGPGNHCGPYYQVDCLRSTDCANGDVCCLATGAGFVTLQCAPVSKCPNTSGNPGAMDTFTAPACQADCDCPSGKCGTSPNCVAICE